MTEKQKSSEKSSEVIARETMTGDLRDCLLDFLKHDKNPLPWNMQPEDKQADAIEKVTKAVQVAVEKAVKIIAADARSVIEGKLEKVVIKDGIKAEVTISKHNSHRHALFDSEGDVVLMVVASTEAYEGERRAARPDPNQKDLPYDDGEEQQEAA